MDSESRSEAARSTRELLELREMLERFQIAVQAAEVGVWDWNRATGDYYQSPRLFELLGYAPGEHRFTRDTFLRELHPDDVSRVQEATRRHFAERVPYDVEFRLRCRDGGYQWLRSRGQALRDESGRVLRFAGSVVDIHAYKTAQVALQEAESLYRSLVELAPDSIQITSGGIIEYANRAALRLFGATDPSQFIGHRADEFIHPADRAAAAERDARLNREEASAPFVERRLLRVDGSAFVGEAGLVSIRRGDRFLIQIIVRDITERKHAAARVRSLMQEEEAILENALVGIAFLKNRVIVRCNQAFARMLGYEPEQLRGVSTRQLHLSDQAFEDRGREATPSLTEGGAFTSDEQLRRKDGSLIWVNYRLSPVDRDDLGKGVVWVIQDITEQKRAEEQLIQLAHYDAATGLPNRRLFRDRLNHALAQARRNAWQVGVLFIDLDRFKWVNDTLGHKAGDALLETVSARLKECLRAEDTVARMGGDEFAIILPGMGDGEYAASVARRILDALGRPCTISHQEVYVSGSIGITVAPADADDADALLRNADAAMYRAKEHGRANYRFFSPAMNERALHFLELESRLRGALARGEFLLHYQPRAQMGSRKVSGVEALLRWQPSGSGIVAPPEFVPLLEETGLIVPVGAWVLEAACEQLRAWRAAGTAPGTVSVNVSPRQFRQGEVVAAVKRAIEKTGIEPGSLEVEITEGLLMMDTEASFPALEELRRIGAKIAIDDFGTGYSSLAHLKRFGIDSLKIDRSLVRDIATDTDHAAIASGIVAMAHSLGLRVVAEGVESEDQRRLLASCGCDEFQGYLLCRPLPAEELRSLLPAGKSRRKPRARKTRRRKMGSE